VQMATLQRLKTLLVRIYRGLTMIQQHGFGTVFGNLE